MKLPSTSRSEVAAWWQVVEPAVNESQAMSPAAAIVGSPPAAVVVVGPRVVEVGPRVVEVDGIVVEVDGIVVEVDGSVVEVDGSAVDDADASTTSCGASSPDSRLANRSRESAAVVTARFTAPAPDTNGVISTLVNACAGTRATVATTAPGGGAAW